MRIGDTIHVKLGGQKPFRAKVVDQKGPSLFINFPKKLNVKALKTHHPCAVYYIEHDLPHMFETTVEQFVEIQVPALKLSLPDAHKIKRIQRREFVRIQTAIDIAVYFPNGDIEPIVTVTQDISGGGIRIILPAALPNIEGQFVDLYFVLKSREKDFEYMCMKAEAIRSHLENEVHSLSLKFIIQDEKDRQKIISHCFAVQRENRKQGLV